MIIRTGRQNTAAIDTSWHTLEWPRKGHAVFYLSEAVVIDHGVLNNRSKTEHVIYENNEHFGVTRRLHLQGDHLLEHTMSQSL